MWCLTKRIEAITIYKTDENETFPKEKPGVIGLRLGKTKEGIVIYRNSKYTFIPWTRIRELEISF